MTPHSDKPDAEPDRGEGVSPGPDPSAAATPDPGEPEAAAPAESDHAAPRTATERIIQQFGGIRPMAAKLKVPVPTVQGWKRRNAIPELRHADILAAAEAQGITLDPGELARTAPASSDDEAAEPAEPAGLGVAAAPVWATPEPVAAPPPLAPGGAGRSAWLAASISVLGAAAAVTAPFWAPDLVEAPALPAAENPDLTALEGRVAFLEQRIAELPSTPTEPIDGLTRRVEALESTAAAGGAAPGTPAAPAVDVAAIEQGRAALASRLDDLAARVAALQSAPAPAPVDVQAQLGPLADRVEAIDAEVRRVAGLDTRVAALEAGLTAGRTLGDAVSALAQQVEANAAGLAAATGKLDALEARVGAADPAGQALVLATGQLREALGAGEPYAAPLAAVRRSIAGDATLAAALAPLDATAEPGIPTRAALIDAFPAVAEAVRDAVRSAEAGNWVDRSLGVVENLVSIRPAPGEVAGDDPAAILARTEGRLAQGDLAGAVEALSALQGTAAGPAAGWLADARARLAADAALQSLTAAAIEQLSRATPEPPAAEQPAAEPPPAPAEPAATAPQP